MLLQELILRHESVAVGGVRKEEERALGDGAVDEEGVAPDEGDLGEL